MIKLVSQFDNEKTKLSLATPTCGGCCCCSCCCCVVSTFATASISSRNFGYYVEQDLTNDKEKVNKARKIGFFFPFGLLISLLVGYELSELLNSNIYLIFTMIGIIYLLIMALIIKKIIKGNYLIIMILLLVMIILYMALSFLDIVCVMALFPLYTILAIPLAILFVILSFKNKQKKCDSQQNEIINNNYNVSNLIEKTNDFSKKVCKNCGAINDSVNLICIKCLTPFEKDDKK